VTTRNGETSGLGSLAWKWRWVLLAAVIVSAGVGVWFALEAPPDYTSEAEVLIPATDPVTTRTTQISAITMQLQDYAQRGLGDTVRSALGPEAPSLQSVTAVQDRTEDIYVITAHASVPSVAERAAAGAAEALIGRSNDLAEQQVDRLKQEAATDARPLAERLVDLKDRRRRLVTAIAAARREANPQAAPLGGGGTPQAASKRLERLRAAKSRVESRIRFVTSRSDALVTLGEEATQQSIERRAASTLVTPPSAATSTVRARLVSTVGLALLVGLSVAFMTILAIEELARRRRRGTGMIPPRPPHEQQRELVIDRSRGDVRSP
jgi:hypothetical protein